MKFFLVAFACLAVVAADVSHLGQSDGYHYDAPHHHEEAAVAPAPEYLPPQHHEEVAPVAPPAPDYLPPQSEPEPIIEAEPAHALGNDGYQYRAIKKLRYRYRH